MSNHDNGRRGDTKRSEHGPRFENPSGDGPSVANARKKWKRRGNRQFRRTGKTRGVGHLGKPRPPEDRT